MAVRHSSVALSAAAAPLLDGVDDKRGYEGVARSVLVQNDSGVDVFIGGPGVTATDYGYKLIAGAEATFDLTLGDVLYACIASGAANVHVLHLGV